MDDTSDDVGSLGSMLRDLAATPGGGGSVPLVAGGVLGGRYEIERPLGAGGMGVVYLARDLRLSRHVAVKLGHLLSPEAIVRIEREGVALAQLAHPNVVVVHEVGDANGRLFIAMEYVAGGNAREWLAAAPRAWHEIALLYAAAGDGLAAAHAAGFVHRDFKPDNVLVGGDGRPRVADFGLVRAGGSQPDDVVPSSSSPVIALGSATRTGAVVGTPAYMAPEQVAGAPVGPAADQYAFCASLWEALYGTRPPARATRNGPRALERILARGLAREPDARWPSMRALVAAIRATTRGVRRAAIPAALGALVVLGGGAVALASATGGSPAAAVACDPIVAGAGELFVDAVAPAGGNGRAGCPLRTISDALAVPSRAHRTIHVAAGTYDTALGERFPLTVRGDVAVIGAGEDRTRVVGTGRYDHRAEGGMLGGPARITLLIGDERATTSLSAMTIAAENPTPANGVYGVVCDRGNIHSYLDPLAPENTVLSSLTIGPGYDATIAASGSERPRPNGCNLRLTASTLQRSFNGLWLGECGERATMAYSHAAIGDGTAAGMNTFRGMRTPDHRGLGIRAWDCARSLIVRRNMFVDGDGGIGMVRHADSPIVPDLIIEGNELHDLDRVGVVLARGVTAARLVDNSFYDIASQPPARTAGERAVALVLDGENERVPGFPSVALARGNSFAANDVAIELRGGALRPGARTIADFGRPDDPGHNSFRCNATPRAAGVPGFDVVVTAPSDGTGALLFAGNQWDHASPTVVRGDAPNGADVALPAGPAPSIDVSGATRAELGCGTGTAGPPR